MLSFSNRSGTSREAYIGNPQVGLALLGLGLWADYRASTTMYQVLAVCPYLFAGSELWACRVL